ncbi:hypothetical protein [Methanolacinia paynteri]|uniref:hypothetical protein n=1 Tax=Methanolacinia paynteri TaxID=230356 RepID=UPI00064FCC4A|nr:hypothetical protein [Methanolacinia paynteri]
MKKSEKIKFVILFIFMFTVVTVSGYTPGSNEVGVSETSTVQSTGEQYPFVTFSSENSTIKVPWPQEENPVPPYSEEEKELLVDEAKQEIIRLFPELDENTLDNVSWGRLYCSGYIVPAIVFSDVLDLSKVEERRAIYKYYDQNDPRTVNVIYDPERKTIGRYGPDGFGMDGDDEAIISVDEAEEHALKFYKKMVGEEYYEEHKDEFYIARRDYDDDLFLDLDICTTYKGVVYFEDHSSVNYDMRLDTVNNYFDTRRDPDALSQITTLSPEPHITIGEAKEILEERLKENNGGSEVDIEYCQRYQYYYYPNLQWLDEPYYMDIEDGYVTNPLKIIWELPYITPNGRMHYGIIDAHTGEIIDI